MLPFTTSALGWVLNFYLYTQTLRYLLQVLVYAFCHVTSQRFKWIAVKLLWWLSIIMDHLELRKWLLLKRKLVMRTSFVSPSQLMDYTLSRLDDQILTWRCWLTNPHTFKNSQTIPNSLNNSKINLLSMPWIQLFSWNDNIQLRRLDEGLKLPKS